MTEKQWLTAQHDGCLADHPDWKNLRCLRLYACACCRQMLPVLPDDPVFQAVITAAEDYADNARKRPAAIAARKPLRAAVKQLTTSRNKYLLQTAMNRLIDLSNNVLEGLTIASDHVEYVLREQPPGKRKLRTEVRAMQGHYLRDIYENPFREVVFDPAWRSSTAIGVARTMYESRNFNAMPILADALQDAGCEEEQVLAHCRDENLPHVRGCWVVDRVLKKR